MIIVSSYADPPLKADKGQFGGSCNRRACQAPGAVYWNKGSYSYYCGSCARMLNDANPRAWHDLGLEPGAPMCVKVEAPVQ